MIYGENLEKYVYPVVDAILYVQPVTALMYVTSRILRAVKARELEFGIPVTSMNMQKHQRRILERRGMPG